MDLVMTDERLIRYDSAETETTIPDGIKVISCWAFLGNKQLKAITIPKGVVEIEYEAFSKCCSLERITILGNIQKIDCGTFYKCNALKSVVLPESIEEIGEDSFSECSALESIVLPEGLTRINCNAFEKCTLLKNIIIPKSVEVIDEYAFAECTSLESVAILGNPIIAKGAFYNCSNLIRLNAPLKLTRIDEGAFFGCGHLSSDVLEQMTFSLLTYRGTRKFKDITEIYVTDIFRENYSWNEYKKITAESTSFDLIYASEEYDKRCGQDELEYEEAVVRLSQNKLLINNGNFVGCILQTGHPITLADKLDFNKHIKLLTPEMNPILIGHSESDPNCPYNEKFLYTTTAHFRKHDRDKIGGDDES